jgi:hypothetical protein
VLERFWMIFRRERGRVIRIAAVPSRTLAAFARKSLARIVLAEDGIH